MDGWLAKGSSSLKKVSEALTRLSMQVAGATEVVLQGDPEPSIKQVLHAVEACRVKLRLRAVQLAPAGSHASNGQAEKAVSTVRRNAMTLKCFLERRVSARVSVESILSSPGCCATRPSFTTGSPPPVGASHPLRSYMDGGTEDAS